MAKILTAFFSRADENYFGGSMRYVKVGNTEIVCGIIKDLINTDSFKIEMKEPYSPAYKTCIEEARKDLKEKARPQLVSMPESIDGYDTIVLAYPNYWGTMPQKDDPSSLHQRRQRDGRQRTGYPADVPRC